MKRTSSRLPARWAAYTVAPVRLAGVLQSLAGHLEQPARRGVHLADAVPVPEGADHGQWGGVIQDAGVGLLPDQMPAHHRLVVAEELFEARRAILRSACGGLTPRHHRAASAGSATTTAWPPRARRSIRSGPIPAPATHRSSQPRCAGPSGLTCRECSTESPLLIFADASEEPTNETPSSSWLCVNEHVEYAVQELTAPAWCRGRARTTRFAAVFCSSP